MCHCRITTGEEVITGRSSGNPRSLAEIIFDSHFQFILKQCLKPELGSCLVTYKVVTLYDTIKQSNF